MTIRTLITHRAGPLFLWYVLNSLNLLVILSYFYSTLAGLSRNNVGIMGISMFLCLSSQTAGGRGLPGAARSHPTLLLAVLV